MVIEANPKFENKISKIEGTVNEIEQILLEEEKEEEKATAHSLGHGPAQTDP